MQRTHPILKDLALREDLPPHLTLDLCMRFLNQSHASYHFEWKLMTKFKFQGPSFLPLHHWTALRESDSTTIFACERLDSYLNCKYFCMIYLHIRNRAWERQRNLPWWSLRTPPIADFELLIFKDASTFHLKQEKSGGVHGAGALIRHAEKGDVGPDIQWRHGGHLSTSFGP